jgi:hypothetical protein
MRAEGHPEADGEHGGGGEGIAKDHGGEEILWVGEELADDAADAGFAFRELPHLPFAEGKEGRFRERKEETCAGGEQNYHHGRNCRCIHAESMWENGGEGKRQILGAERKTSNIQHPTSNER